MSKSPNAANDSARLIGMVQLLPQLDNQPLLAPLFFVLYIPGLSLLVKTSWHCFVAIFEHVAPLSGVSWFLLCLLLKLLKGGLRLSQLALPQPAMTRSIGHSCQSSCDLALACLKNTIHPRSGASRGSQARLSW